MEARIFEHASAMPAPTWYFLHMNDATIEIPAQLSCEADAVIETDATLGDATAFVEAMEAAQTAWDKVYGDKPVLTNAVDEQAEELGGLALSAYQKKADAMEQAKSLAASFEQGMGEEVSDWIREMACQTRSIIAPAGSSHTACIQISSVDGGTNTAAIDLVAHEGATLDVAIIVDSPAFGMGVTGSSIRIFAAEGAHVTLHRVQTLDDTWTDLDDMGLFAADNATIDVHQTVLGAGKSYTALQATCAAATQPSTSTRTTWAMASRNSTSTTSCAITAPNQPATSTPTACLPARARRRCAAPSTSFAGPRAPWATR